jgi:hypothetical protein
LHGQQTVCQPGPSTAGGGTVRQREEKLTLENNTVIGTEIRYGDSANTKSTGCWPAHLVCAACWRYIKKK